MWEKWRNSGAVGNMESARRASYLLFALPPEGLAIVAIGEHYAGLAKGNSTLSLGSRVVFEGSDWEAIKPVAAVVAPGHHYKVGQVITRYPEGTRSLDEVFAMGRFRI